MVIETKESNFTVYTEDENVFLEMLHPANPKGASNDNTSHSGQTIVQLLTPADHRKLKSQE